MFCPQCGLPKFDQYQNNEYRCGGCEFTYFHNVAAAVSVIIRCDDEILLITRAQKPGLGMLDLPGGFVDPNESLEQALFRELKEELNIDVDSANYLYSFPNQYLYKKINYFTLDNCFEIRLEHKPRINLEAREISDYCWLKLSNIEPDRLAFESTRLAVKRYVFA
ncbi:MAG: NAD+ diphosphatase [Paraglaciecola sp.]|jgi:NAD+ diphosphatase